MATVKKIKKAQVGKSVKPSADSSTYFHNKLMNISKKERTSGKGVTPDSNKAWWETARSYERQSKKGKPGYDKDGFPIKKQRAGGKIEKAEGGKLKKAQDGETLIKKKETTSGSMSKYKSNDGNYTTKIKYKAGQEPSAENPEFRGTIKKRRTLKGFLTGAPKPMKKGGKVVSKKK